MVSLPLDMVLTAATVGLAGLLLGGVSYAVRARRESAPGSLRVVTVAGGILFGWVGLVFLLGGTGAFAARPDRSPVVALGIGIPIVLGWFLLGASSSFREALKRIPLPWLIGVQLYRVLGVVFLVAYGRRLMPAEFALPAGVGDILVGITALPVAYALARMARRARSVAVAWNVIGIADLVLAVTMGFLTSPSPFQQLALDQPNAAITRFPFVLVPTYAVPVSILLHLFSLWRLRVDER